MRRRGIALIISLLLSVLTIMFVAAAVKLVPSSLGLAAATSRNLAALRAAEAGVQYAAARLRQNPAWRGDATGEVVSTPDLVVLEDRGNVVGVLRSDEQGEFSQFLLRFNQQDDATGDTDGLADPGRWISSPYVSINNLMGTGPVPVPRGDGASYAVTATSARPYSVPAHTACLLVEGRSGPGLRDIADASSGTGYEPQWTSGPLNTQVVEVFLQVTDVDGFVQDAVSMSYLDTDYRLKDSSGQVDVVSATSATARARSNGAFRVQDQASANRNYLSPKGAVHYATTFSAATPGGDVDVTQQSDDSFYKIAWNKVRQAGTDANTAQLAAGTYVVREGGQLYYFNMNYDDYVSYLNTNHAEPPGGTPAALPAGVTLETESGPKYVLRMTKDVNVAGTGTADDFAFIPRNGAAEDPEGGGGGGGNPIASEAVDGLTTGATGLWYQYGSTSSPKIESDLGHPYGSGTKLPDLRDFFATLATGSAYSGTESEVNVNLPGGTVKIELKNDKVNVLATGGYGARSEPQIMTDLVAHYGGNYGLAAPYLANLGLTGAGALPPGKLDSGQADALKATNLGVQFAPASGENLVLSAHGNLQLTGTLNGQGALTSHKNVKVVGLGTTTLNSDSVSLYAQGNITFSSLQETQSGTGYAYNDIRLKGLVYAWGDVVAKLSHANPVDRWGHFDLEGAMVAYGRDLETDVPNGSGRIDVRSTSSKLTYNPIFIMNLFSMVPPEARLTRVSYHVY